VRNNILSNLRAGTEQPGESSSVATCRESRLLAGEVLHDFQGLRHVLVG
jgi:hypothetical protein